jgi:hypothetical protein
METIDNKQYKECSVVMLATDKAKDCLLVRSRKLEQHKQYFTQAHLKNLNIKSYHLYILGNDEPEIGDWKYDTFHKEISQVKSLNSISQYDKKIIATTDKSLRLNSVKVSTSSDFTLEQISENIPCLPQIPQSFIDYFVEQYNKGNVIDKVLVEYINNFDDIQRLFDLEEPKINANNTINILTQKDSWSRDEVIELMKDLFDVVNQADDNFYRMYNSIEHYISKNI